MKFRKIYIIAGIILLAVLTTASVFALRYYKYIYSPNSVAECEIFIHTEAEFQDIKKEFEEAGCLNNLTGFEWVADRMNYTGSRIIPGRYIIREGLTNRQIVQKLRSGEQDAVNVVIPSARDLGLVTKRAATNIEADSQAISQYIFSQALIEDFGIDPTGLKNRIIPNTYKMWWNSDPKALISRLLREYEQFWNQNDREQKAEKLGLSREEVIILASIVDRETNYVPEMPKIAGVYLNRLESNWPLQADPTVVFALGNPEVRRVLNRDLEVDSPYNTYKHTGLPPGPISIPPIAAIDAVLNPEEHNYYYFCAKPGNSRQHAFSRTLNEHLRNARKFQNWLNQQRIMR
ncbi:MAG: endolytic transglycosylase MltG [Saprospirales bacterium]|nr:MAG: endolytic transglycosylase MltG [Saprospirales bacterium]